MATNLLTFLSELATNPQKMKAFIDNPDAAMDGAGLSDEEKNILKSGNQAAVQNRLAALGSAVAWGWWPIPVPPGPPPMVKPPDLRLSVIDIRTSPGPYFGRGPRDYFRSDERIREEVCERLAQHGWIDASNIEVTVSNGEVSLTGSVTTLQEKQMAEDALATTLGVKEVNNQLHVIG